MSFSFLYKEKSVPGKSWDYIKNLSIDRIVQLVTPDIRAQEYMLEFLSSLETNKANIIWRQELARDFINNVSLFERITELFSIYEKTIEEWTNFRKDMYRMSMYSSRSSISTVLDDNSPLLFVTGNAGALLKIFKFYRSLVEVLSSYNIKSEMLINLNSYCRNITDNPAFNELEDMITQIASLSVTDTSYEVLCELDSKLRIVGINIYKMGPHFIVEPKKKGFFDMFRSEKAIDDQTVTVEMNDHTIEQMNMLIHTSVSSTAEIIELIMRAFCEPFDGMKKDLAFYDFALSYHQQVCEIKGKLCFPEIRDMKEDCFQCRDIYDLLVTLDGKSKFGKLAIPAVANDVILSSEKSGILVRGKNNSGKTVYLRSIGVGQVFAQAGLPVAAQSAVISIRSGIFTQFSTKEENHSLQGIEGRFESEVKTISQMMETITAGALVLLNETFQTTAFEEAKSALFDILSVFARISVKWILVTHIHGLFDMTSEFERETSGKRFMSLETYGDSDIDNRYKLKVFTGNN